MTKRNKNFNFLSCKNFVVDSLKECKIKTILVFSFSIITFLTGIIVAIRTKSNWGTADGLGIIDVRTGGGTSTFFTRFLSMLFVYLILFASSNISFLFPIGLIFLAYRSYMLGLNICLIIVLNGFLGAIVSLLIVFPIQFLVLLFLSLYYLLLCRTIKDYKCFGGSRIKNQKSIICLISLALLLLLCLFESILLLIFNAKIILVI